MIFAKLKIEKKDIIMEFGFRSAVSFRSTFFVITKKKSILYLLHYILRYIFNK